MDKLLRYELGEGVEAFSTMKDAELPYKVLQGQQVHDDKVAVIKNEDIKQEMLDGNDAFVTNLEGCAVGVRTADCVPVLIFDPVKRVVAAVHAGWKGTVKKISQNAIRVMSTECGSKPEDLVAVIGPCIMEDSFQVGEEVVAQFRAQGFPMQLIWSHREGDATKDVNAGHHINLVAANRYLLEQVGVKQHNIQECSVDTFTNSRFYSARREGIGTGRILNVIRLMK